MTLFVCRHHLMVRTHTVFVPLSNGNVNKTSNTIRVLGVRVVNIAELRTQIPFYVSLVWGLYKPMPPRQEAIQQTSFEIRLQNFISYSTNSTNIL